MDAVQQKWEEEPALEKLEKYEAPRPSIKVSLGLVGPMEGVVSPVLMLVSGLGDCAARRTVFEIRQGIMSG